MIRSTLRGACVAAIAGAVATGCGPRNFANENDALRQEREVLRDRIADLERELAEARILARQGVSAEGGLDAEELAAATPMVARIEVDRLSGLRAAAGRTDPDTLIVRIRTMDGRGRFTQVAGSMAVRAERMRPGEPGAELGEVRLGPLAVRDAFRDGLGGSWYAVEVPVPAGLLGAGDRVGVSVVLTLGSGARPDDVRILDGLWERFEIGRGKTVEAPNTP